MPPVGGRRTTCRRHCLFAHLPSMLSPRRLLTTAFQAANQLPAAHLPAPLQLRVYYADARSLLPPSDQEASLTALNLLRLLVQVGAAKQAAGGWAAAVCTARACMHGRAARNWCNSPCVGAQLRRSPWGWEPACLPPDAFRAHCRTASPSSTQSWRWCRRKWWQHPRLGRCGAGAGRW